MKSAERFGYVLLLPAFAVIAAFVLGPVVEAFWTSLHVDTPFAPRRFVGLENYGLLWNDEAAWGSLWFTLGFVVVSVGLELMAGLAVALVIDRAFWGRGLVRAAVLVPWAVPTVVAAILWKYMFNDQYGLVNLVLHGGDVGSYRAWLAEPWTARAAIVVADVWRQTSFAALLLLAGLQTIPRDLYEAARLDGAGALRRFWEVTLPLLRPAILIALLFRTMDAFRVFDLVFVMTEGGPGGATSVLQLYGYKRMFPEQMLGYGSAVSVVVFVLVLALSLVTIRVVGPRGVFGAEAAS